MAVVEVSRSDFLKKKKPKFIRDCIDQTFMVYEVFFTPQLIVTYSVGRSIV